MQDPLQEYSAGSELSTGARHLCAIERGVFRGRACDLFSFVPLSVSFLRAFRAARSGSHEIMLVLSQTHRRTRAQLM